MSREQRNFARAISEVSDRVREVNDLLLDAQDAMKGVRPKDAWRHLNDAKAQLEGAMVIAKWSQTLFPEDG